MLIAGYAENKNYPISFDAINFSPRRVSRWILKYPVFGLLRRWFLSMLYFIPHALIPKPDVYPHIAHFVTAPEHKGQGYALKSFAEAEDHCATYINTSRNPWYSRRTSMACQMYEVISAFKEYKRTQLPGKVHTTIFFFKHCNKGNSNLSPSYKQRLVKITN